MSKSQSIPELIQRDRYRKSLILNDYPIRKGESVRREMLRLHTGRLLEKKADEVPLGAT